MARSLRRKPDECGARVISQLTFQIRPGANFNRRSTREKCARALSVIRTRRRDWGGKMFGLERPAGAYIPASMPKKEVQS